MSTKCFWGISGSSNTSPLGADDLFSMGNDIFFNCVIDSASINKLHKEIITVVKTSLKSTTSDSSVFEKPSTKMNIRIIIDSPGGNVYEVLKFIDFIDIIKSQFPELQYISCINGVAASSATLMAIVADQRQMTKNSSSMIHQMSIWDGGEINFVNQRIKHYNDLYNRLVDIYVNKTHKDKQFITELLSRESWFDSQHYLEMGFIDKII